MQHGKNPPPRRTQTGFFEIPESSPQRFSMKLQSTSTAALEGLAQNKSGDDPSVTAADCLKHVLN